MGSTCLAMCRVMHLLPSVFSHELGSRYPNEMVRSEKYLCIFVWFCAMWHMGPVILRITSGYTFTPCVGSFDSLGTEVFLEKN
jgi:hypothetical protein